MKNLYFLLCLFISLFSFHTNLFCQLTNRWEIADSTGLSYSNYYYYNPDGNMAGFDDNDIVVVGRQNEGYFKNNRYTIKRYSDNGRKIEVIYNDTIDIAQRFHSVSHPTKNVIVVAGDTNVRLGIWGSTEYYKSFGLIMLSNDAGITWEMKKIDSNKTFRCISMCDSLNGIILQSDIDNYFNPKEDLYDSLLITSYGWRTVNKIAVPEDAGYIQYGWCISPQKFYLLCENRIDASSFIYITTDGGINWKQSAHFEQKIHISDIEFLSDKKIYVAANRPVENSYLWEPVIYKSNDGGDNWQECKNVFREIEEDVFYLYSIDFYDSLNGIAIGGKGRILRTSNGGDNWIREYIPYRVMESTLDGRQKSVFYPNKDFAFTLLTRNYTINCFNNKFLLRPKFYSIINPGYLPLIDTKISWTSIAGADRYWLKVDTTHSSGLTGGYDFEHPLIDTILTDTSIVISNLVYDRVYHYWVKSINNSMESEWSDENSGFATIDSEEDLYSPNLIYPPKASRVDNNKVTLRWHKVSTAERYHILISNNENSDVTSEFLTDTTISITDLVPSAFYYVTLESIRGIHTSYETWSYFRTRAVLGIEDDIKPVENDKLNIYPNPFSNKIKIDIEGNNKSETIIIYDIFGRIVYSTQTEFLESGKIHNLILATEEFPSGVYFLNFSGSKIGTINRGIIVKI